MPKADDPREEAIRRLDERADALEARTTRNVPDYGGKAATQGAQLVAGLIGGPLVGLAFGWGFDYFAGTAPWGLIVGLLIGFAASVFLANPAPVCVLDEVDAPLDDANVDRFCNMLVEMRERTATRFIVITHNPVTMSRMDRLYGVTMPERGVSQLVSVDLRQAEAMAAQ